MSVCLSVTLMHSIETAKDIIKHFSRPDSSIVLLLSSFVVTQFQRELPKRSPQINLGLKFAIFGQCLAISWKR